MPTLKPCPFANSHSGSQRAMGEVSLLDVSDSNGAGYAVTCSCGATGPVAYCGLTHLQARPRAKAHARALARRMWNDR